MKYMTKYLKGNLLLVIFLTLSFIVYSQEKDSTKAVTHFSASVTINSKGISTIPNFTLGKPAAIFFMSVGRKISFEPEFRFALEGKPWMYILWWRYELLKTDKFNIGMRANASLNFKTIPFITDGISSKKIVAERALTGDLYPTYSLTKNISAGVYYMYVRGIEEYSVKNIHYLALRCNFSNIKLSDQFYARFYPQAYYLRMDKNYGYYVSASLALGRRNFPVFLSSLITTPLQSRIPNDNGTLWNVGLTYTFNKEYVEK